MGIARSTYYDRPKGSADETALVEAMHAIKDERGPWLAVHAGGAQASGLAAGLLLDGVEGGDPFQRFGSDRRALGGMDVEELAAHMRQA